MKGLHTVTFILLVIGGLSWGLVVFDFEITRFVGPTIAKVIYSLVGLAALVEVFTHKSNCKCCDGTCEPKSPQM